MSRNRSATPGPVASRHVRDLQVLRQGQLAVARPHTDPPPLPAQRDPTPRYTFNWRASAQEGVLVPRLLQDADLPSVQMPAVRQLINVTALGQPTTLALRRELLAVDPETLAAAIIEGIHRWHTYATPTR